jgi:hypothetical protein
LLRTLGPMVATFSISCADTVPVYLIAKTPPHEVLEEAGDLLGYPIELVDFRRGAIMLEIVEVRSQPVGMYYGGRPCRAVTRSNENPLVVAHEIGHALGLQHIDVEEYPDNLMSPRHLSDNTELVDWQLDELDKGVRRLGRCTRH